ncbi:MAG: DUF3429 domain-containing protein [Rhodobacteraceae bacterium]|nr:DUF3429 domain-containing protein [Paracoccaceae bacterium]
MSGIPRSALTLGLAGVAPFAWGALTEMSPALFDWGMQTLGPRFVGQYVLVFYGTIILSFMSGALWGFATKARGTTAALAYGASTLPALWALLFVGGGAERASWVLIAGYMGLLVLDYGFWRLRLAPDWWMDLRQFLTALVVGCLVLGLLF